MTSKKWVRLTLSLFLAGLAVLGGLTVVIDPYFHYHAPLSPFQYELINTKQRYINDGISKHFKYDAILTGTSMVENVNTSLIDELFGVRCIKVPYEGAGFNEVDLNLRRAIEANPDIRYVFRSIDYYVMDNDKDDMLYDDDSFPYYLYNDSFADDVKYVFNKSILFESSLKTISYTLSGGKTTDFDNYSISAPETFGRDKVDQSFSKDASVTEIQAEVSEELRTRVTDSILQNYREVIDANPQIEFYLFISPCSIAHWDLMYHRGYVSYALELERTAAKLLADAPNVHFFVFDTCTEIITDLDNYRDIAHYSSKISDRLFNWMHNDMYRLTPDMIDAYFDNAVDFFSNFNYEEYFPRA